MSWKEDTRKLANASSCIRGCPAYWRCAWAVSSTTCAWSRVAAACAGVCLGFLACKRPKWRVRQLNEDATPAVMPECAIAWTCLPGSAHDSSARAGQAHQLLGGPVMNRYPLGLSAVRRDIRAVQCSLPYSWWSRMCACCSAASATCTARITIGWGLQMVSPMSLSKRQCCSCTASPWCAALQHFLLQGKNNRWYARAPVRSHFGLLALLGSRACTAG